VSLERYRQASLEVLGVFGSIAGQGNVERASVDEAFIDLTDAVEQRWNQIRTEWNAKLFQQPLTAADQDASNSPTSYTLEWRGHVYGSSKSDPSSIDLAAHLIRPHPSSSSSHASSSSASSSSSSFDAIIPSVDNLDQLDLDMDARLCIGSQLVDEMRARVRTELRLTCSAGLSVNKVFAKLGASLHKPDQQTIVPPAAIPQMMREIELQEMRHVFFFRLIIERNF
jgi:DNA polymerase eta